MFAAIGSEAMSDASTLASREKLVDGYGRAVTYLRISVTDRCDFRCTYCMAEDMQFLPKKDILDFEEVDAISQAFIERGVRKIRLTGGEPLVRRDIMKLITSLSRHLETGDLEELTLTTNGSQLSRLAGELAESGIRRINVSLDTRDADKFAAITRRGRLPQVMEGIAAAKAAGLAIKINMVAMRGSNEDEIIPMMEWAHGEGFGLTLIEGMPLGDVGMDRNAAHLPLREVHEWIEEKYQLTRLPLKTGGPARYFKVEETGGQLGYITPMSHTFCESCNRVRLTATGKLYLCLGHEAHVDLRSGFREGGRPALDALLDKAMIIKPKGHDFLTAAERQTPAVARHMSVTGG